MANGGGRANYKAKGGYNKQQYAINASKKASSKVTVEYISATHLAVIMSYDLFYDNKEVSEIISKNRDYYDFTSRASVFTKEKFDTIRVPLANILKRIDSKIILEYPPGFTQELTSEFPLEFKFQLKYEKKTLKLKINYDADEVAAKIKDFIPIQLLEKMYDFQKTGIEFGLRKHGRCLIADEMGVGKTIQALGLICCYPSDWPVLILAPATLKYNWLQEIGKWLGNGCAGLISKEEVQVITSGTDPIFLAAKFVIISYDTAARMADDIDRRQFRAAILDEAHYLKNPEAQRSKALIPVIKKSKRVII
jgi:SNF2 family DNA or RNA helicase